MTSWQPTPQSSMPSLANLAGGTYRPPATARGVAPAPVSTAFVLPSPESLGVKTQAPAAVAQRVDWQAIQDRLARLRTLEYKKTCVPGGVAVRILLPTADPTRGQPVQAQAETEHAAAILALQSAEAWAHNRR